MTKERRSRQRQAIRAEVLDAACLIASKEGWEAVTMRRLAAEVEYTPPMLYEWFGNKAGVVTAVVGHGFTLLQQDFNQTDPALPPKEQLAQICLAYWQFSRTYPEKYQVMFGLGMPHFSRSKTSEGAATFEIFYDVVARAQPQATSVQVRETAVLIWSALHGLISLAYAEADQLLKGIEVPTLINHLITTIVPAPLDKLKRV